MATIAVQALARKGVTLPDPKLRRYTRGKVRAGLCALDKGGVKVRIGKRTATRKRASRVIGRVWKNRQ